MSSARTVERAASVLLDLLDVAERAGRRDGTRLPPAWCKVRDALLCVTARHHATSLAVPGDAGDGTGVGPLLLDLNAAAVRLGLSRRSVERLINSGELPAVRIVGKRRVRADDLAQYVTTLPREETPA